LDTQWMEIPIQLAKKQNHL